MGGRMYLGNELVTPVIVDMSGSSGDDWGQSLQGSVVTNSTFICAPTKCVYNTKITSFSAPNAEEAVLYQCFLSNISMTSASLPNLKTIYYYGFNGTFSVCSSLSSVELPALTTVKSSGLRSCFANCTSLTEISFDSLTVIEANALTSCFSGCTSLTDISFGSLTTQSFGSYINQFNNMLSNTGTTVTHTLHFPSNLESTIQGLQGYPNFGGTSGSVVLAFDLPSTS